MLCAHAGAAPMLCACAPCTASTPRRSSSGSWASDLRNMFGSFCMTITVLNLRAGDELLREDDLRVAVIELLREVGVVVVATQDQRLQTVARLIGAVAVFLIPDLGVTGLAWVRGPHLQQRGVGTARDVLLAETKMEQQHIPSAAIRPVGS